MEENKAEKRVGLDSSGQGLHLWPEKSSLSREGNIGAKTYRRQGRGSILSFPTNQR